MFSVLVVQTPPDNHEKESGTKGLGDVHTEAPPHVDPDGYALQRRQDVFGGTKQVSFNLIVLQVSLRRSFSH